MPQSIKDARKRAKEVVQMSVDDGDDLAEILEAIDDVGLAVHFDSCEKQIIDPEAEPQERHPLIFYCGDDSYECDKAKAIRARIAKED